MYATNIGACYVKEPRLAYKKEVWLLNVINDKLFLFSAPDATIAVIRISLKEKGQPSMFDDNNDYYDDENADTILMLMLLEFQKAHFPVCINFLPIERSINARLMALTNQTRLAWAPGANLRQVDP